MRNHRRVIFLAENKLLILPKNTYLLHKTGTNKRSEATLWRDEMTANQISPGFPEPGSNPASRFRAHLVDLGLVFINTTQLSTRE
jgi:hypothetical protein